MGNAVTPAPVRPVALARPGAKPPAGPAAAAATPAEVGYSQTSSFTPGARTSTPAPQRASAAREDIGPDGDDDKKKSKYYDPALNQKKFNSRENRVFQQPNIPQKLKDALLKEGKTITDILEDDALSKLLNGLPEGSDALGRATGLACSNLVRRNIRRSWISEVNASALKLHY